MGLGNQEQVELEDKENPKICDPIVRSLLGIYERQGNCVNGFWSLQAYDLWRIRHVSGQRSSRCLVQYTVCCAGFVYLVGNDPKTCKESFVL